MEEIYKGFDNSDIVILAAPLYFNTVNSITKHVIDRCQKYWSIKYQLEQNYRRNENRIGFLAVGEQTIHEHFSATIPTIDLFLKL